jgi:transposase
MEAMGVIPYAKGVVVHDKFVAYVIYDHTLHALCNAHLVRELKGLMNRYGLTWPARLRDFLFPLIGAVNEAGGRLDESAQLEARKEYPAEKHQIFRS